MIKGKHSANVRFKSGGGGGRDLKPTQKRDCQNQNHGEIKRAHIYDGGKYQTEMVKHQKGKPSQ